jgi:hypothetical protein
MEDQIWTMGVTVNIDDIAVVKPLDNGYSFGVESDPLYSLLPSAEIVYTDGRKLPVLETAATVNRYLDAYRELEGFYTAPAPPAMNSSNRASHRFPNESASPAAGGNVIPLFSSKAAPCATSEASTPD